MPINDEVFGEEEQELKSFLFIKFWIKKHNSLRFEVLYLWAVGDLIPIQPVDTKVLSPEDAIKN